MLKKPKIIVIICGEAAIFCLVEGVETKFRIFCPTLDYLEKTDLGALMRRYSATPLYILLDSPEQTFASQRLPGVGSFAIGKLADRRLERDYHSDDIKGAVNYGRDKSGRKDWRYLFANMPLTDELEKWMEHLSGYANPMMGVFLLPLEAISLIKQIDKNDILTQKKDKKKKKKKKSKAAIAKAARSSVDKEVSQETKKKWLFLNLTQKTGGIRQIIFEDGNVYFTRYVRFQLNAAAETIAGVIEQEMVNTIDYLRRLSFTDKDTMRAVVVASNEVKNSLGDSDFGGVDTDLYSPYELSVRAGLNGACRIDDKYTDILLAVSFLNAKPTLRLFTDEVRKNYQLFMGGQLARYAGIVMVPAFFLLTVYGTWNIFSSKKEVERLENRKAAATQNYNGSAALKKNLTEEQAKEILAVATIYTELQSKGEASPREMIGRLAAAKQSVAKIKDVTWLYAPADDGSGNRKSRGASETLRVSLDFVNAGGSPESLFSNFEDFTRTVNGRFDGYRVEYSKLPDKLTFNNKTDVVPVTITITQKEEKQ